MDEDHKEDDTGEAGGSLLKEREAFVKNFLRKGVEFTEELLRENVELQHKLSQLEADNTGLRTQVKSDDAIRDLLRTIEALEKEKRSLLDKSSQLEQASRRYEGRYAAIEQELNDLANLYVASFQLHATLRPIHVIQHIKELLAQLVGAERFVLYLLRDDGKTAHPIAFEGVMESELSPISVGEGAVGKVCASGVSQVKQGEPLGQGTMEAPLAVLPMQVDSQTVGAIAIVSLLEQKVAWAQVDQELFHLLGSHAATALLSANLYSKQPDVLTALEGLAEALK